MAPSKWDDEESESTPPSSPPVVARRGKFDDEEEDSDVLETWEEAEDSEVERQKATKAEEARLKAEAEAKANHLTKSQRIEQRRLENLRKKIEDDDLESEEEDENEKRLRLRRQEKEADLNNAVDLFGDLDVERTKNRSAAVKPVVVSGGADPTSAIDLSALPLFKPTTKDQFSKLRDTLVPLITANSKKAQYSIFLQDFVKALAKDLPSEQIRKAGTALSTLSNEKMKEEKAAEKGGKKSKAAKTKSSLNANRDVSVKADTAAYEDTFGDDDFM